LNFFKSYVKYFVVIFSKSYDILGSPQRCTSAYNAVSRIKRCKFAVISESILIIIFPKGQLRYSRQPTMLYRGMKRCCTA
jgi:hypothetical protein